MPDVGLWHVQGGQPPRRLEPQALPTEKALEDWIAADPSLVAPGLHAVRRQVPLGRKYMDLLAVEAPGVWVVCELKKVALERESLAQAIDYVARLDQLSRAQLEELSHGGGLDRSPQARDLIRQALEREDNGEGREIRIVLAGIGVSDELTRMVTYLSANFAVPIRVCTLSAVGAPDGSGIILMRDISEDTQDNQLADVTGATEEERFQSVRSHFASHQLDPLFDAAVEVFRANPNLYVRPWKKALMVAPAAHHGRYLAYLGPRKGAVFGTFGADAIEEFFPGANLEILDSLASAESFASVEAVREWAQSLSQAIGADAMAAAPKPRSVWNGRDWYFSFGEEAGVRAWSDASRHGFASAGGGEWFSRTLRNVPVGARIFARIPQVGYVGVGQTTGPAVPFTDSPYAGLPDLACAYEHANGEPEWVLPVTWLRVKTADEAVDELGLFANTNSACKLRDAKTIAMLEERFGLPANP
jgi:hypothetical protein